MSLLACACPGLPTGRPQVDRFRASLNNFALAMFFQDRNETRNYFFRVWGKHKNRLPLEPVEVIIADVILEHPEYHHYLEDKETSSQHNFRPEQNESNPFLHMGLHIALKEQISADRPAGVVVIFNKLLTASVSVHDAEHKMMRCLGQWLWDAQKHKSLPDEQSYLECLKGMV